MGLSPSWQAPALGCVPALIGGPTRLEVAGWGGIQLRRWHLA